MKNSRSKKLLACFLAALGLSMNSLNVSAKYGQTREDIKFLLNISCDKSTERENLDKLADNIDKFLNEQLLDEENNKISYSDIARELYKNLYNIVYHRREKKYSSDLLNKLTSKNNSSLSIIDEYPGNKLGILTMKWMKRVAEETSGGKLTVFGGKIKNVLPRFLRKLKTDINQNQEDSLNNVENNNKNGKLIKAWSTDAYIGNAGNDSIQDGINCYLYENGHLVVECNASGIDKIEIRNILNSSVIPEDTKKCVKSVSITGQGITSIGDYTFAMCEKLISIEIPDSVKHIGNFAFFNCTNLKEITIPNSVESINANAFCDCPNLNVDINVDISEGACSEEIITKIKELLRNAGIKSITVGGKVSEE